MPTKLFTASQDKNGADAFADPFKKVDLTRGSLKYFWLKPTHTYWPFIVEVCAKSERGIAYWFLNSLDGTRLHTRPVLSDLEDPGQVYPFVPSTAQKVDLNADPDAKYGFLLVDADYYAELEKSGAVDKAKLEEHTDVKNPPGHGHAVEELLLFIADRAASNQGALSTEDKARISSLLASV